MRYDEVFGQVDQEVVKSDRLKPVQYSQRQREMPLRQPAEPVTMEYDLPEFEKRKTIRDVAFSSLPLINAPFSYLRAGEEARLRGEGFMSGMMGETPLARRQRRAMQSFYQGAEEELPDWVKVLRQTGVPGGPFAEMMSGMVSAAHPIATSASVGGQLAGESAYLESQARTPGQRIGEALPAIPQGALFGGAFGIPAHVLPAFLPQRMPEQALSPSDLALMRRQQLENELDASRGALASYRFGNQPQRPSDDIGGNFAIRTSPAIERGLTGESPGLRKRIREFKGGPVSPEEQARPSFVRSPSAQPEALSPGSPFDQGPPPPQRGSELRRESTPASYMASREELAASARTPEQIKEDLKNPFSRAKQPLESPQQSEVLPQSGLDDNQRQVLNKAQGINENVWVRRFQDLRGKEGLRGQALIDRLKELHEEDMAAGGGFAQEPSRAAEYRRAFDTTGERFPTPAGGLRPQRTSAQRPPVRLDQQSANRIRDTYERKVREIESADIPDTQRKVELRQATAEYQEAIETRVQTRDFKREDRRTKPALEASRAPAGRPAKFDWPAIAKNWASKEWASMSEEERTTLRGAYNYFRRAQATKANPESYAERVKERIKDGLGRAKRADQLDRSIEGLYQTTPRDTNEGKYYHSLRSYLYRGDVSNPKRNTLVESYYGLSGDKVGVGVSIKDMYRAYLDRARQTFSSMRNQKQGKDPYIKDEHAFRQHLYKYGRRIQESFEESPTAAAPWVIDGDTDTIYLSPYMPNKAGMRAFAETLPLDTGLRVLPKGGELLVPEVPKGRVAREARDEPTKKGDLPSRHESFRTRLGELKNPPQSGYRRNFDTTGERFPTPAGGLRPQRTSAARKAGPGGGDERFRAEWLSFQKERYRAEWGDTNAPGRPTFEEWLRSQPKDKARESWGGKTYTGATGTRGGKGPPGPPRPPGGGTVGPATPPPPRGPRGPDDIFGPKGRKTTPMGSRVTGETKMEGRDFGSPYRAGSSGLPLGGPKPNQRRQFVNPELRTGTWAAIERVISPAAVSAKAAPGKPLEPSRAAEQIIRAIEGTGRRQVAQGSAAMDPYVKAVYDLPKAAQLDLIHYIQTGGEEGHLAQLRKTDRKATQQFENFTRGLANLHKGYEAEIASLDRSERQNFMKNYLSQIWKEKTEFRARAHTFLKERKMMTYKEGIEAGFTPVTENPIEIAMMYMGAMRKYLDIRHSIQEGKLAGYIRDVPYKASPPPNTRLLDYMGRGGRRYYANEDFARVFNNYISKGVYASPELGGVYNGMLRLTNASTALQLGLSAFHLSTMVKESFLASLADGVKALSQGKPVRSLGRFANSVRAPYSYYKKGDQLLKAYLGEGFVDQDMEHMAQLAARANMRLGELDEVYRATAMGSYAKNIVRGIQAAGVKEGLKWAARTEGKQLVKDVQQKPITASLQLGGKLIETVAHPLFYHFIPRLKAGVFMERMGDFLRDNPAADMATQVREAQRIADVVDDQFGELVQNNLFWDNSLKQVSNLLLTSTGWTLGTLRLFGQGAADVARGVGKTLSTGRAQPLTDRSAYLIATVIGVATLNALYQALKAGDRPRSVQDLATPRTGGETVLGDPERALIPGYEKDIMGWWHDPIGEAYNKMGPLPKTAYELMANKDWRGDPIRNPDDAFYRQALEAAGHAIRIGQPITLKTAFTPTSPATGLSGGERFMGVRAAGGWITNPERTEALERRTGMRAWKKKLRHEERDKARQGYTYDQLTAPAPQAAPKSKSGGFTYEDLQ